MLAKQIVDIRQHKTKLMAMKSQILGVSQQVTVRISHLLGRIVLLIYPFSKIRLKILW